MFHKDSNCFICCEKPCVCNIARAKCEKCRKCSSQMKDQDICRHCNATRFGKHDIANSGFAAKHMGTPNWSTKDIYSGYRGSPGPNVTVFTGNHESLHFSRTSCVSPNSRASYLSPTSCQCEPFIKGDRNVRDCYTEKLPSLQFTRNNGEYSIKKEEASHWIKYRCDDDKKFRAVHYKNKL